jgi:DNA protecting protein DprA
MPSDIEIILHLLQTKGLGPKGLRKVFAGLIASKSSFVDMLGMSVEQVVMKLGLGQKLAERILDFKASDLSRALEDNAVSVLPIIDDSYPMRLKMTLGDVAPPVLFAKGNLDILDDKSVGFCGARKASEKGLRVAALCAEALVKEGINVSSGYANGVDMKAHTSALEHGGTTTIVLAEGIQNFRIKKEIKDFFDEDRAVIVSEFFPTGRWFVSNAMQRNRTILGLSKAMMVIEAAMKGGTYAAAMDAIEHRVPLFFADYKVDNVSSEGNRYFLSKGANAIRANRHGEPNIDGVMRAVNRAEEFSSTSSKQLQLI